MNLRIAFLALTLLFAGGSVQAQGVYKSTMPDGKVIYAEKPVPGAAKVDKMEPPPAKTGTIVVTPEEKARAEQAAKDRAAAEAAKKGGASEARKQLEKAQAARDAGKEPLPGERIGTAGGKSRLTDDYYARQKKLEQDVAEAQKRVETQEKAPAR